MSDIALNYDGEQGVMAMGPDGRDILLDEGLRTAIILSLFTDQRANDEDDIPDGTKNRRGWWGDNTLGSRLWLLRRKGLSGPVAQQFRAVAGESLQWMVEEGVAARVDVDVVREGSSNLLLNITVTPPDGVSRVFPFFYNWETERIRAI